MNARRPQRLVGGPTRGVVTRLSRRDIRDSKGLRAETGATTKNEDPALNRIWLTLSLGSDEGQSSRRARATQEPTHLRRRHCFDRAVTEGRHDAAGARRIATFVRDPGSRKRHPYSRIVAGFAPRTSSSHSSQSLPRSRTRARVAPRPNKVASCSTMTANFVGRRPSGRECPVRLAARVGRICGVDSLGACS
jgi:hypothetical protein